MFSISIWWVVHAFCYLTGSHREPTALSEKHSIALNPPSADSSFWQHFSGAVRKVMSSKPGSRDWLLGSDAKKDANKEIFSKTLNSYHRKVNLILSFDESSARKCGDRYNSNGRPLTVENIVAGSIVDVPRPSGPRSTFTLTTKGVDAILQLPVYAGLEVLKKTKEEIFGENFLQPKDRFLFPILCFLFSIFYFLFSVFYFLFSISIF